MQSPTPVPAELAPYYTPPARTRFRHAALLILPFLAVVVVLGALVAGGWWLTHRSHGGGAPNQKSQLSQNGSSGSNGSNNIGKVPTYLPSNPRSPSSQPGAQPTKPKPTSKPTPAATDETNVAAKQQTLTNTGPSAVTVLLPLLMAAVAIGGAESYQQIAARRQA
jgi:hypothetical protein